jgi:hypothetical protein
VHSQAASQPSCTGAGVDAQTAVHAAAPHWIVVSLHGSLSGPQVVVHGAVSEQTIVVVLQLSLPLHVTSHGASPGHTIVVLSHA